MTLPPIRRLTIRGLFAVGAVLGVGVACGDDGGSSSTPTPATTGGSTAAVLSGTVKLGFFPNVTHAPALVGVAEGLFTKELGSGVNLKTFTFSAGPEASEAILSGAIDLAFIGPSPAVNAFARSKGEAIRIVAGSTSGGAFLIVKPEITVVADLKGKKLATPQLGNTQDVALRAYLKQHGLTATKEGGGDVSIIPQANATTLDAFKAGAIDGAWVPEPWATRLVDEGGGKVLVDERGLWPETRGKYVTTQLIVRTDFLDKHPDLVKAVIEGLADSVDFIAENPARAQGDVVDQIASTTGRAPKAELIAKSWANLEFTLDPIAASLQRSAKAAEDVGLLQPVDLTGIYDLTLLNGLLAARGQPEVKPS
jgi:NitT/TauT family transport system substrate-binding protein